MTGFFRRPLHPHGPRFLCLVVLVMMLAGCSVGAVLPASDVITVTGDITVRGNEPFTEVVLITQENNWYVLDLTRDQRAALMTPARARVTGILRLGEWSGRPFTRLKVDELVPILE